MGISHLINTTAKIAKKNRNEKIKREKIASQNKVYYSNINNNTNNKYEIKNSNNNTTYQNPYHKVNLLTNAEKHFYLKLKEMLSNTPYEILAKVRLADLINVNNGLTSSEWGKYFGKIKAKHIDFAIHLNMTIICLIELDDYTHERNDRIERDEFINKILPESGYAVIRTAGDLTPIRTLLKNYGYLK